MNYHLFVDNFRGFSDTCIPITDVNFLVGENSTGKSSILGLIKLFSGSTFLMSQDFSDGDIGFSHYSDMVSAHSEDQSYFRIGFVSEVMVGRGSKSGTILTGSLFTFGENQGQPRLLKCTFCRDQDEITIKFGGSVYAKTSKCVAATTSQELIAILRSRWIGEHCSASHKGFTPLPVPRGLDGRLPVLVALSLASTISGHDKNAKSEGNLVLYPPMGFTPTDLTWFGPIRTKPRRTYDELLLNFSPEGQHTPYLIRRMLKSKSHATKLRRFIEKVGKASGLFHDVRIKSFGRGATARFELDIVLDGKALNILNVGYGVSQSLPIIVELMARGKGTWFAIQEPEIHLHPRAQAAFGDVLFEMATIDNKRFLVETHSDFAIDRFRMKYKNGSSNKPDSQVLFFERRDKHNVVTPIAIDNTRDFSADQPETYRQFFVREQMNLLGL